jgi:uncharacterized protein YdeI (YjbR/CyaY-like superfamily)
MPKRDPRVDAYIEKAAPFARPILKHLRRVIHAGCPEVQETIKWSFPHFGRKGILCGMAAFKGHCAFCFWKSSLVFGNKKPGDAAMGQFGRITSIADLPDEKTLIGYVRKAAALNEKGTKIPEPRSQRKKRVAVPYDLKTALGKNARARKTFENFSYTNKKDYAEWITEAKRRETRTKRLKTAIAWMAKGRTRNWKYR